MSTFYEQNYEGLIDDRQIDDGIYDITNIKYLFFDSYEVKQKDNDKIIKNFQKQYPDWCYANPYGNDGFIILSKIPSKISKKDIIGTGFNYGSCNIIQNCPASILITAEDD